LRLELDMASNGADSSLDIDMTFVYATDTRNDGNCCTVDNSINSPVTAEQSTSVGIGSEQVTEVLGGPRDEDDGIVSPKARLTWGENC